MGQWWEERGLTFTTVDLSGHMVPQYQPSSAYRQLEYLLGRIDSLSEVSDFTVRQRRLLLVTIRANLNIRPRKETLEITAIE